MTERTCVHGVIMESPCTLCFREFEDRDTRRLSTHIEHDWNPRLTQLDPADGPLTVLLINRAKEKNMGDDRSIVGDAFENFVEPNRTPWSAIIVGVSVIYLLGRFLPWAVHGFGIAR